MGFINALGRLLRASDETALSSTDRERLLDAWGLTDTVSPEPPVSPAATELFASEYDRTHWERKLRTVLDGLPESESDWPDLVADASALGFDESWVRTRYREEFALLIRQALADGRFSPQEHRHIDLARILIGMPDDEAEQIVAAIVAEAEAIFGREVEGKA